MSTLTEVQYNAEFMVSEAPGSRSREAVSVASGQNLKAGTVIGKKVYGTATETHAGNTGDGVMGAITVGAGAKAGVYNLTIIEPGTNVGTFQVEDPDGIIVGNGVVAAAFTGGGLSFTLADGSTDFIAGDRFLITVAAGAGTVAVYDPAATNGTEDVYGILRDNVDASGGALPGVAIVRDAEVNASELIWFSGATTDQKNAGLAALAVLGIIGR